MTREELQAALAKAGIDFAELTAAVRQKIDEEKQELDTTTRRKVRAFWVGVSAVFFLLGGGIGFSLARIFS